MLKIITAPPQRAPTDPPLYTSIHDPAWDFEQIAAERLKLANGDDHPWGRWMRGETGYSREAPLTLPDALRTEGGPATVTVSHWIRPGALPTMFELRVLSAMEWETATFRPEVADLEVCRRAIIRVHNIDDGSGSPITIEPPREHGLISLAWMDLLSAASRDVIGDIAEAAERMARGVSGAGKP